MRRKGRSPAGLPKPAVIDSAVALFAVVAHPARLWVLVALARRGPMAAGELQTVAGLEQTAMSHQLRALREADLIVARRQGRQMIYELADDHVAHIVEDTLCHVAEPPRKQR